MKKKNRLPFWKNPRLRYGSLSTLMLCLFLAVLVVLNGIVGTLEKKNGWRKDYSFNALTTQSDVTLQVLDALPYPVHIYALFAKGQEDQPLLELLDRYAAASDLVTWEQTDVTLNPGLLTRFSGATSDDAVSNNSLIVSCEATGRHSILSSWDFITWGLNYEQGAYEISGVNYEGKITSAIRYVTQDEIPRVVIPQAHGELDESGTTVFAELLRSNSFQVDYVDWVDESAALSSDDLLVFLSPVRDVTDAEMDVIADFTAEGGSILFTCDFTDPIDDMPNYGSLLRSYGFEPKEGVVLASPEEPDTYYNDVRMMLIPTMQETDITADLLLNGTDTLLLAGSRAFALPQEGDRNLVTEAVLTTSYKAYLRDLSDGGMSIEQTGEDEVGPFALALMARRTTEQGDVSRAFVLGASTLLTDVQIHAMTDSQEFIIRVAEYLLNTEPMDLGIVAKAAVRPRLSARSVNLGSVVLVALPLMVLGAALLVLLPRRNK